MREDYFPSESVFAEDLNYSSLRLITCHGKWRRSVQRYTDNLVVYARPINNQLPTPR